MGTRRQRPTAEHIFGQLLAEIRAERGMSQEALSFACGRHRTHISLLERGLRSPTLGTLIELSEALRIPLDEMMRRFWARLGESKPRRRQRTRD